MDTQTLSPSGVDAAVSILKAAADRTRFRVLWALADEECSVGRLAELVDAQVAAVSQHLAKLRTAGLVSSRRAGTHVLYRVAAPQVRDLLAGAGALAGHPSAPENATPDEPAEPAGRPVAGRDGSGSTRDLILGCAAELFAARGYSSTPLTEVSSRLDITKAALYYYFPGGKDEILATLVTPVLDRVDQLLAAAGTEFADVADRLELLWRYIAVLRTDSIAVDIITADVQVRSVANIGARIDGHRRRFQQILMGDDPDDETRVRVWATWEFVSRTVRVGDREEPLAHMPPDERWRILLQVARETLQRPE